jgi:hypothetical protein
MPKTKSDDYEKLIQEAIVEYHAKTYSSIRSAAAAYGIPYETVRNRLRGTKTRQESHKNQQLLTVEEEKAIVRFCLTLDDWGHPLKLPMIKEFATALLPSEKHREIGQHWMNRFLRRNPNVVARYSQRLDRQRATASDPAILEDFFRKVFSLPISAHVGS